MDEGPNPYAPPLTDPRDRAEPTAEELLTARFEMTAAWRRATAHALIMPGAGWLTSSMFVLLGGMAAVYFITDWVGLGRLDPAQLLMLAVIVGGIASIVFHISVHEVLTRRILQRMSDVPVLAADGEWIVVITADELTLRSPAGDRAWPLAQLWWHPVREPLVLLQLPRDLPLGIPPTAECGRLEFREFAKAVRKRVRAPGLSYFLRD